MASSDAAAWERLGQLLVQRRAQIDPKYGRRTRFAEERHLGHRVVYELEKARRRNFGDGTLASIEAAYELAPGAIKHYLEHGGELETAPASGQPAPEPAEDDRVTRLEVAALDLAMERMLGEVRGRIRAARPGTPGEAVFPENHVAALIFEQDLVPLDERAEAIALILLKDRQRQWQRSG